MARSNPGARAAQLERWALTPTPERAEATKPARDAFLARFEAQVPDEITDPQERRQRALALRRAHMIRLAKARHATSSPRSDDRQ